MRESTVGNLLEISKLEFSSLIGMTRTIDFTPQEKIQDIKYFERLLKGKLIDTILHRNNEVIIEFLNKKFLFSIKSASTIAEDELSDKLASISLNDDVFYLINSSTSIRISNLVTDKTKIIDEAIVSLYEVGGIDNIIDTLRSSIELATGSKIPSNKIKISRGCILYGVSGVGKSMLCRALAGGFKGCQTIFINSWKIFSKFYGESESNLKRHFEEAFCLHPIPTIIIIEEISNICPKNDSSDAVRRVSSLLASLMDSLHLKRQASKIFVLANTSRLDNIDPSIRRSGRFDTEIEIPVPTREAREAILSKMLKGKINEREITEISKHTHGFVGSDLQNLIKKSTTMLKTEHGEICLSLTFENLVKNLSLVKPSALRELLVEKPNTLWSDIGGMEDLKLKLKQIVEWPINHPETFERLGIQPPSGLLMFGPPGCSKTMIAKALATESNLNFISIKGSDLFSMWVGESEKAVRDLFVKARQLSPSIVFFDEIDAICGERSAESGSSVKERVLAQILTEIDGVTVLKNVIIIAATNRPDLIDSALMRPGRLDRIVYVKLPDAETRREIFKIKLSRIPISDDVKIVDLVEKTAGYSGAEIEAICKEAVLKALEDSFEIERITMKYFERALEHLKPRTSIELLQLYNDYESKKL